MKATRFKTLDLLGIIACFVAMTTVGCKGPASFFVNPSGPIPIDNKQVAALIQGAVLPVGKTGSRFAEKGDPFDVVVIDDAVLRNAMMERYKDFAGFLRFAPTRSIAVKEQRYVLKDTQQDILVDTFLLISRMERQVIVEWDRYQGSLGGSTYEVTLEYSTSWNVVKMKLKSAS